MIRGIAFDLEGTIVDVEEAHHLGHLATAKELGIDLSRDEAIAQIPSFIGGPDIDIAMELQRRAKVASSTESILQRMQFHYKEYIKAIDIKPRQCFLRFLRKVKRLGIKTSIGSVTPRAEATRLMRLASISEYFEPSTLVFSEDVTSPKPSPDVYQTTAARMGISPVEQLVFEDSARGITSAVAAGSFAIAVPTIYTREFIFSLLQAGASRIFWSWEEIDAYGLYRSLRKIDISGHRHYQ
jgi:beta-phosphoglucomutase